MPKAVFGRNYPFLSRHDILTYEEIARLARIFVDLGVRKIRLTGGEPLLRRDLSCLIGLLAEIPGIDLTLTTNGTALAARAGELKAAGLNRITVSLDALSDVIFQRMNDADYPVQKVIEGIESAVASGFSSIKINMVVKRGVNEAEILPMVRWFRGSGHILRFIEYMDVGNSTQWDLSSVVPAQEILDRIGSEFPLEPVAASYPGEVAERWRYRDGAGEIGVIASVTRAFCSSCTRLRLSTDGKLYSCLFAAEGYDLRSMLREQVDDVLLKAAIAKFWASRVDRYSEQRITERQSSAQKIEMSYIGG